MNLPKEISRQLLQRWPALLLVGVMLYFFVNAISNVDLGEVADILTGLLWWQIAILIAINFFITIALSGRWWWILKKMEQQVSFLSIYTCRLAAFALSYLSPGAHFGGEPLQVLWLRQRHNIRPATSAGSILIDRSFVFAFNLIVLLAAAGGLILLRPNLGLPQLSALTAIILAIIVFAALLFLALDRRQRFTNLLLETLRRWADINWVGRLVTAIDKFKTEMNAALRKRSLILLSGGIISSIGWLLMALEFGLALHFLDGEVSFNQGVIAFAFARAANWVPVPAAVGALEGGQTLAFNIGGTELAIAVALTALIRCRDLVLVLIGIVSSAGFYKQVTSDSDNRGQVAV